METIIKARRLFQQQGLSIWRIGKQLNINRRTVTQYLQPETLQATACQRSQQHYPALNGFIGFLRESLQQQLLVPAKQRLSAQQHYEHLQSIGFTDSYNAVRRFVAAFYKEQP